MNEVSEWTWLTTILHPLFTFQFFFILCVTWVGLRSDRQSRARFWQQLCNQITRTSIEAFPMSGCNDLVSQRNVAVKWQQLIKHCHRSLLIGMFSSFPHTMMKEWFEKKCSSWLTSGMISKCLRSESGCVSRFEHKSKSSMKLVLVWLWIETTNSWNNKYACQPASILPTPRLECPTVRLALRSAITRLVSYHCVYNRHSSINEKRVKMKSPKCLGILLADDHAVPANLWKMLQHYEFVSTIVWSI